MTTSQTLQGLLRRLANVGIPPHFARRTLPSWWDDAIANDPSGLQQAQLLFARAFNLEPSSLSSDAPRFRVVDRKFKLNKNVDEGEVATSAQYAAAIAKIALVAMPRNEHEFPAEAKQLRDHILTTRSYVDLESLLEVCRSLAIPVIHIKEFPGKKITGLAVRIAGRYAIILGHSKHPAYMLFNLAHEIGHIACGHLQKDGFIADEKIDAEGEGDAAESEANRYAIIVLNGQELQYTAARAIYSAENLFSSALSKSKETRVDVGHIILNYAKHNVAFAGRFAQANQALKLIGGEAHGEVVVNNALRETLRWDLLSEDQADLLRFAAGMAS